MSSFIGRVHDNKYSKWIDPMGWYSQDGAWKSSTRLVHETSEGLADVGDKWGWNTWLPEKGAELSAKDKKSIGRWGENTLAGIGAFFGGMYAGEALGGGGSGAGGTTYLEAGGGSVTSGADGSLSWINADGTTGSAAGNSSGMSLSQKQQLARMLGRSNQQQQNAGTTYQPTRSTSGYQEPGSFINTWGGT